MKLVKKLFIVAAIALLLSPMANGRTDKHTSEMTLVADGKGSSTDYVDFEDQESVPKPTSINVKSI